MTTMLSSNEYQEPSWARDPPENLKWSLTEIKGGIEVAKYSLDRPCSVLGRLPAGEGVHVTLHHESCSRKHARIAFDGSGIPWLRDMQSTHGTTVNKKKLPAQAIGRHESNSLKAGSRGIILYPGDIIRFGASTRFFCVEGPSEFARGVPRKPTKPQVEATINQHADDGDTTSREHAMSSSPVRSDGIAPPKLPSEIREEHISDKYRKEWDKIKALKHKLNNVKTESERIQCKGELSLGQERHLQRNEERVEQLKVQIEFREDELFQKLSLVKTSHRATAANDQEQTTYTTDDDDVDDRTKNQNQSEKERGETEESLTAKWKALCTQLRSIERSIVLAQEKIVQIEKRLQLLRDRGDEDAFFVQNELSIEHEAVKKGKVKKQSVENSIEETERLLKIVNPKLKMDRRLEDISDSIQTGKTNDGFEVPKNIMPINPLGKAPILPANHDSSAPLPLQGKTAAPQTPPSIMMPPPPTAKRQRVLGPKLPAPPQSRVAPTTCGNDNVATSGKKDQRRNVDSPVGTLAVLNMAHSSSKGNTTQGRGMSNGQPKLDRDKNLEKKEEPHEMKFDPKKDVWHAPKDQDGSGITKLNAKFQGRY